MRPRRAGRGLVHPGIAAGGQHALSDLRPDLVAACPDGRTDPRRRRIQGPVEASDGSRHDTGYDAAPAGMDRCHAVRSKKHDGHAVGSRDGQDDVASRRRQRIGLSDAASPSLERGRAMNLLQPCDRAVNVRNSRQDLSSGLHDAWVDSASADEGDAERAIGWAPDGIASHFQSELESAHRMRIVAGRIGASGFSNMANSGPAPGW